MWDRYHSDDVITALLLLPSIDLLQSYGLGGSIPLSGC